MRSSKAVLIGGSSAFARLLLFASLWMGCERHTEHEASNAAEITRPPFPMRGDLEGLFLVWFDQEGAHTAGKRSEIPEAHRQEVRVDSLAIAPEQRLDPEFVYVADLRAPGREGQYAVRKVRREDFEAHIEAARRGAIAARRSSDESVENRAPEEPQAHNDSTATADVIIYGASWCGACHTAAQWLTAHQIPFVEKDIEREPGAREEMMRKAEAAGIQPSGIPVIDVRGQLMMGFDPHQMQAMLAAGDQTI